MSAPPADPIAAIFAKSPHLHARYQAILADPSRSRLGPDIVFLTRVIRDQLAHHPEGSPGLTALAKELRKHVCADHRMACYAARKRREWQRSLPAYAHAWIAGLRATR
jgi:hypothetical protein